jgi:SSS family solute:Na+ symporter
LLVGWAAAMVWGTVVAYNQKVPNTKIRLVDGKPVTEVHGQRHFGSSVANFPFTHVTLYIAVSALAINIVLAVVLTVALRALRAPDGRDETADDDYYSDAASEDLLAAEQVSVGAAGVNPGGHRADSP